MSEAHASAMEEIAWKPTEHTMKSWDGTRLFYRAWLPQALTDKAVILFHRGHEHSGRWQKVVERLDLKDTAVFALDARGHGRSPGERGYAKSFDCLVKDVDAFVRFLSESHRVPLANIIVMAQSVGSVVVSAWVHDYAPPIRALVLGVPALRIRLYVPFAVPLMRLWQGFQPKAYIQSYVKAKMLTHDPDQARLYREDPLITRAIAVNILLGLYDVSTRLMTDAAAIRVPTLVLGAGADWVVSLEAQKRFFAGLSSPVKEMVVYDGFYHDIFHEKDRHRPIAKAREFILEAFACPPVRSSLLTADKQGFTRAEFDQLAVPLPPLSPKRLGYGTLRLLMRTLGQLSEGIRIGWRTGFDSGQSLNYVYENRARGWTLLGKMIDRTYLDSVGWRGIRKRKVNLERLLGNSIDRVRTLKTPVRIVDIASGPGRYLLDTVRNYRADEVVAVLRDRSPGGLEEGRTLAREIGLANVSYQQGDAFDCRSLATLSPKPDVAIVSGLYELFSDNQMVLASLQGLSEALEQGGYLIYTNQPWHPQVELIARTLINRDGKPWVMRRRTQEEMDEIVLAAGFEKLAMEIDEYGIFTVSLARKRARA